MNAEVPKPPRSYASRAARMAACVLLFWGVPAEARAFRLPVAFAQSADIGGGGGRYFTGSPSDRYTCKVCHAEGGSPNIVIRGLPVDGYYPGSTYAISIDWDDRFAAVAFNFEMTDGAGSALGTFSVPPPAEVPPAEQCSGKPALVVGSPERTLAILASCGAQAATIRWTAPPALAADGTPRIDFPQAWLSGSLLVSNKDESVEGDGVTDVSRVFDVTGQARPPATQITGSCSVLAGRSGQGGFMPVFGVIGCVAWLRRRRRTGPCC